MNFIRVVVLALAITLVFVLTGCKVDETEHSKNQDPRKGRVSVSEDCWDGGCYYDYKVCVGPDLFVSIGGGKGAKRWVRNSEECKP